MGLVNAEYVEIKSGLQPGEQVIYAGYQGLHEGDPVVPTKWGPSGPVSLPPATGEVAPGTVYTCPMHPEVRSAKPGVCPKCGMTLEPVAPAGGASGSTPAAPSATRPAPKSSTGFYCPMHPEVRSGKPGKCPKCGMDLKPVPSAAPTPAGPPTGGAGKAASGYTCPMHPEVHSDRPGKCPKCGMDLVPAAQRGGRP